MIAMIDSADTLYKFHRTPESTVSLITNINYRETMNRNPRTYTQHRWAMINGAWQRVLIYQHQIKIQILRQTDACDYMDIDDFIDFATTNKGKDFTYIDEDGSIWVVKLTADPKITDTARGYTTLEVVMEGYKNG